MKRVQKNQLEKFTFESVNSLYEQTFRENWNRQALTNYKGASYSYGEVAVKIAKLHLMYESCGLRKGDRVAICAQNQAHWVAALLSVISYGAIAVPLLHEFKPGNIHHLVNHSESRILFVDQTIWNGIDPSEMPGLEAIVKLDDFSILHSSNSEITAAREAIEDSYRAKYPEGLKPEMISYHRDSADELALINYTSGTSGFSKGVMIPYRALCSNILFARKAVPAITNKSNILSMLPAAHMYGLMFEILYEFTVGARIFFLTKTPSPAVLLEALAAVRPTVIIAVPLIIDKVYKSKVKPVIDKPAMKVPLSIPGIRNIIGGKIRKELVKAFGGQFYEVIVGGAAFNREVEEFMNFIKFPITVGYGMTECAPILAYADWDKTRVGSCGKAARFMEIRIDSIDPARTPGEVQIKGPNVFLGYYNNEKATDSAFTSDGWFRTGDMGIIDKDGFLYLKGRSKCMILGPSGQNIYPEEIEGELNNLNYVVDSLVVEENSRLIAIIFPDRVKATRNGLDEAALREEIDSQIRALNKEQPSYLRIAKTEFLEDDFERTPKKSIKRYLYQKD